MNPWTCFQRFFHPSPIVLASFLIAGTKDPTTTVKGGNYLLAHGFRGFNSWSARGSPQIKGLYFFILDSVIDGILLILDTWDNLKATSYPCPKCLVYFFLSFSFFSLLSSFFLSAHCLCVCLSFHPVVLRVHPNEFTVLHPWGFFMFETKPH